MRVIFQTTAGPLAGRDFPLQTGDRVRVGRAEAADICFATDSSMALEHFEIHCLGDACVVRALDSQALLAVNDEPVTEAALIHDDQVAAGSSLFRVQFPGRPRPVTPSDEGNPVDAEAEEPALTTPQICDLAALDEEVKQLVKKEELPEAFVQRLIDLGQLSDAVYFLAAWLKKRDAVFWGLQTLATVFEAEQDSTRLEILEATRRWLVDPTDAHRRAAMELAEAAELRDEASCVAAAAFWSEGSMAPEGMADVLPDSTLTAKMVGGAMVMAATSGPVPEIDDRYRSLLQLGRQVASGELDIEQALKGSPSDQSDG